MSSLRRRRQVDRVDVPLPVSFARSGAACSIPWRRPRRRWQRREPAPGSGGGTSARRHRRLTRSECTPLRLRSDLPSGGGLPICPTTSGHPPTLHLTAPSLPVARAPADRGSRRAVGWRRPRSELIVRPARRVVRSESSALSRGAEGRPPMPERRLERAYSHIWEGARRPIESSSANECSPTRSAAAASAAARGACRGWWVGSAHPWGLHGGRQRARGKKSERTIGGNC